MALFTPGKDCFERTPDKMSNQKRIGELAAGLGLGEDDVEPYRKSVV